MLLRQARPLQSAHWIQVHHRGVHWESSKSTDEEPGMERPVVGDTHLTGLFLCAICEVSAEGPLQPVELRRGAS